MATEKKIRKTTAKKPASTKKTTTKKSGSTKKTTASSSNAPYILIIMALAAGLLFLLSLQTDYIKNFIPSKKNIVTEKKATHVLSEKSAEKKEENKTQEIKEEQKKEIVQKDKDKEKEKNKEGILIPAKIYFLFYNEKADKIELRPVMRNIDARTPIKSALDELIKGPSKMEEKKGYVSAIPPTLKVIDVSVVNKIAFINFNNVIEEGAAGNIMLNRLDQIIYTTTQFDNVEGIHILVQGQRKRFIGPDGISIAGPLKRH